MKLTYCSNYGTLNEKVETFENIEYMEYEDQTQIKNGMWLHIKTNGKELSIEFNPKKDLWRLE